MSTTRLIDNDRVQADLRDHLAETYGEPARDRYWAIFEELRSTIGYADYLGALQRYRLEEMHDPRVLRIANWLADYPFAERLYPSALDAVRRAQDWGTTVDPVRWRRRVSAAQGGALRPMARIT